GTHIDITERKQFEETIEHRNKFDKLVAEISSAFLNATPDSIDDKINDALRQIGEFFVVDRSFVFRHTPDWTHFTNTHEWCADGIAPVQALMQNVPLVDYPWWKKQIATNPLVVLNDINNL